MQVSGVSAEELRLVNILIVEDELLIRMIVSDGLRDVGYNVIEAINGDEAVEILSSGAAVDLVFSDVRMPGSLDGLGLLGFIRTAFPGLPVVITSGHLQPELALADGATQFLAKPYGVEQMIKLIQGELAKMP
jgi:CheY-like chemotaxis protein